jgi:hypothetical protein
MNVRHILIDDTNLLHRELPIYREGQIDTIRLADTDYRIYSSMAISAHDLAAMFHFGVIEAFNALPFISESGNGLDSWDEAFLASTSIPALLGIVDACMERLQSEKTQQVVLGWQDEPVRIAYWRALDPEMLLSFLRKLREFAVEAQSGGFDLEFVI